jgi:hypothetical protein
MPNVHTACWTLDDTQLTGNTTMQMTDELQRVALLADTMLTSMGDYGDPKLLILPEYYFNAGGPIASRTNKHAIYRRLENISAQVPELVLIAGTIAYEKNPAFGTTKTYAVCPVLQNGAIVKKLYKAGDDGVYQINGAFRSKNDGGKAVPVFNASGLSIAVDICMDYSPENPALGRVETYVRDNNLPAPDIHIQISGTNLPQNYRCQARPGGVYFHCDLGQMGANGATAWRVVSRAAATGTTTTTTVQKIQPTFSLRIDAGGFLRLYDTEI